MAKESSKALEGEKINSSSLRHLGIILDGNGRWAKKQGLERTQGHRAGMEAVVKIVRACSDRGIKALSLYAFSTENWKRPEGEVTAIMGLLIEFVHSKMPEIMEKNCRITMMGDPQKLPLPARKAVQLALKMSEKNTGMILNIGLNYGGRAEIVHAVKALCREGVRMDEITEEDIRSRLYTADLPPLDLLIRTGGECRLSNFMIWQAAYAEFYFTNTLWPDFTEECLDQAIQSFNQRDRRFGGIH